MANAPVEKYEAIKAWLLESLNFEFQLLEVFQNARINEKESSGYPTYSAKLAELLAQNLTSIECIAFLSQNNDLEELRAKLDVYAESKTERQAIDRFYSLEGDPFLVRYRKLGKRFLLKTGWFWIGFTNLFRRKKKAKEFWTHEIPEAALAESVFVIRFGEHFQVFLDQLLQRREKRIRQFYSLDRQLEEYQLLGKELADFEERTGQLQDELNSDKREIALFFEHEAKALDDEFRALRKKAGTFEHPAGRLTPKKLAHKQQQVFAKLDQLLAQQHLVFFALAEHWRLKVHNRSLIFKLKEQSLDQVAVLSDLINQNLKPAFIAFKKELSAFAGKDPQVWDDRANVLEIKSFVKQRMPGLIQLIFQAQLTNKFDQPVLGLERVIVKGPEFHQFAASVFAGKKISRKSFRPVATRDLLKGSVLGPLKDQFAATRKKFVSLEQKLSRNLEEIQYSANYSVDFYLAQKKDENASIELVEGLKRAVKRTDDILGFLAAMQKLAEESFSELATTFAEQVLEYFEPSRLHQSEKLNQRREFIRRRKVQLSEIWSRTVKLSRQYFRKLKELYHFSSGKFFNLRNLLGVSYEKEPISAELANYLSETRQAIRRLPLMYQRLFENVPLNDDQFYIPRRNGMQKLNEAYDNWKAGRFSPVCIIGEQGSGITTILNFFSKSVATQIPVKRMEIPQNIFKEEKLLQFIRDGFPSFVFKSVDELIDLILEGDEERVIVLENIHNLFLRSSGHFGNLFHLFKLISQTNSKIFWITSCDVYGWKLLNHICSIGGYFAYVVEFSQLTTGQLQDAIMKRHQVSGFSLHFLEPENFTPKRNYQKLSDDEKQLFLRKAFFEELGIYAQSNLSLAFIYWLRAIQKVEEGDIFIQQKRLNYSFLNSLKTPELTTLHSILIHGGLDLESHSRIFRCGKETSFRMLMVLVDDGMLEKQEEVYVINPLIYRMLVSQLKSLNFIY